MQNLSDEHLYLLLGKITGSLSVAEEKEINSLIDLHPEVLQIYENMVKELRAVDLADHFHRFKQDATWTDPRNLYNSPKTTISAIYRKITIAALVAGLLAGTAVIWNKMDDSITTYKQRANINKTDPIQLRLPDGQKIILSGDETINAGDVQLVNANNTLIFSLKNNQQTYNGTNSLTVPEGMDYKIILEDGTEVWLNSTTRIDFPFTFQRNTREIFINGEAYLKVANNPGKPFLVHLPGSTVQVLGTEFNVNTYDSGMIKISLLNGAVQVKNASSAIRLYPGREAILPKGQSIITRDFRARDVFSWKEGLFYFNEASLTQITQVIPRWFGLKTSIDDTSLMDKTFSGVINKNQPIEVFIDDLKAVADINIYLDDQNVLHFSENTSSH